MNISNKEYNLSLNERALKGEIYMSFPKKIKLNPKIKNRISLHKGVELLVEPQFYSVGDFSEGLVCCFIDAQDGYGFIDVG